MAAHTIRLREPWERSRDDSGMLRLRRRFGLPTGLHSSTCVNLVISGLNGLMEVRLNGAELVLVATADATLKWDITSLLESRNEICLAVVMPDEPLASGEAEPLVRLEIEDRTDGER